MIQAFIAEFKHLTQLIPTRGNLRGFVLVLTLIPLGIAGFRVWLHDGDIFLMDQILAGIAAFIAVSALIRPLLVVEYKMWMGLALILGFFVSNIILTAIFYLVITPVGFLMRWTGHDPLEKTINTKQSTYWRPLHERKPDSWKRQF